VFDGNLVRLDLATGNLDRGWSYPREDGLGAIYSDVLVADGAVYGSGYTCRGDDCEGEIFAVDLIDGFSIWGQSGLSLKTKLIGQVGLLGTTLFVGTSALGDEDDGADGYLYALDTTPGTSSIVKWRIPLDGNAWGGVAVEDSMAYLATMAGTVYAINVEDAEPGGLFDQDPSLRVAWTFETGNAIAGPLNIVDENIYFINLTGKVSKINIVINDIKWTSDGVASLKGPSDA
jgi:outer membrane protein assembly factor BamB